VVVDSGGLEAALDGEEERVLGEVHAEQDVTLFNLLPGDGNAERS
jgi:hypothetical protein